MIPLTLGFIVASVMGTGTTYLVMMVLALAYPKLWRVLYWMMMLPLFTLGPALLSWIFLPIFGIGSWSHDFFWIMCGIHFFFPGLAFCKWTDPPSESVL